VKTNRRDALNLAKLHRAGELTAVWVPDARHEAMRDLVRARDAALKEYTRQRLTVSSFLLRLGVFYPGKKTWGPAHLTWPARLKLEHREQRIAFEEMLLAVRQARERMQRQSVARWVKPWRRPGRAHSRKTQSAPGIRRSH
jgi:transposase